MEKGNKKRWAHQKTSIDEIQVLEESTVLQVVLDDDVSDGVEDKLHVLGVGGAGEVGVDLFSVLPPVQILKLTLDVGCCLLVRVGALESWSKDKGRQRDTHK